MKPTIFELKEPITYEFYNEGKPTVFTAIVKTKYSFNNKTALLLVNEVDHSSDITLSVNLDESFLLGENEIFADNNSSAVNSVLPQLIGQGILSETILTSKSGFVTYNSYKANFEGLKELSIDKFR